MTQLCTINGVTTASKRGHVLQQHITVKTQKLEEANQVLICVTAVYSATFEQLRTRVVWDGS